MDAAARDRVLHPGGLGWFSAMFRSKQWLASAGYVAVTGVAVVLAVTDVRRLVMTFAVLLSFLLAGSALLRYGDRIPLTGPVAGLAMNPTCPDDCYPHGEHFRRLPAAYLCLWTATVLPRRLRKVDLATTCRTGSISTAFLSSSCCSSLGELARPAGIRRSACVAVLPFAAMSWLLVERPAMRMKTSRRWGGLTHHALPGTASQRPPS